MTADREQAKRIILKIIKAYGGELEGKVRLMKAYYYAHLRYWEKTAAVLCSYPIVRLPNGPALNNYVNLISDLERAGYIRTDEKPVGKAYVSTVFSLLKDVEFDPTEPFDKAISDAAEFTKPLTGKQLSDWTHETSHSWNEAKDGEAIDIYRDLMPKAQYLAMKERIARIRDRVANSSES